MHQILLAYRTGTMFDVCERLVPLRAVSAPGSSYSSAISVGWVGGGGLLPMCYLSVGFACLWVDLILILVGLLVPLASLNFSW